MTKKQEIVFGGIILITVIFLTLLELFIPHIQIELNGKKYMTLEVGSDYVEEGATATLHRLFKNKTIKYDVIGQVNTSKLGKYTLNYASKKGNIAKSVKRYVEVVDSTPPEINILKPIEACKTNNVIDLNVSVIDNYDGDITDNLKYQIKDDKVFLEALDSSNNKKELTVDITYIDNDSPKLTLKGNSSIYLQKDDEYVEYGASAIDSCDGDLSNEIVIDGSVNTAVPGTYKITYSVTDHNGNKSLITRNVIVTAKEASEPTVTNGIIYLTFDDGPGVYTESFLEVLAKYNVKATFFVTGQFPKYQSMIKKEYEEGHTIGIHTYSHKWSIYSSTETYLEDFNKIKDIVIEETGVPPTIFRFPGGSSNTVSRKYKVGIMTELAKIMTDNGYTYFDWTFDSGDTSKNKNTKEAIIKTVKENLKGNGKYIILMHDIKKNTLLALPEIIEYAQKQGYIFKTLDADSPVTHFKIAN